MGLLGDDIDREARVLEQMKRFVGMFHLLAPTIEEYATAVEKDGRLDAGNSYGGILYELGKLLERFKELIKEGLQCEISAEMRVGTMETLDANIEAMERDLAEILRLSGEQERLWKAYEDWKGR